MGCVLLWFAWAWVGAAMGEVEVEVEVAVGLELGRELVTTRLSFGLRRAGGKGRFGDDVIG